MLCTTVSSFSLNQQHQWQQENLQIAKTKGLKRNQCHNWIRYYVACSLICWVMKANGPKIQVCAISRSLRSFDHQNSIKSFLWQGDGQLDFTVKCMKSQQCWYFINNNFWLHQGCVGGEHVCVHVYMLCLENNI